MDKDRLRALVDDGDTDYIHNYIESLSQKYDKELHKIKTSVNWSEYFQTYSLWVLGIFSLIALWIYGIGYYRRIDNAHTKVYLLKAENCLKNNSMSDCLYVIDQTEDKELKYILKQKLSQTVVK